MQYKTLVAKMTRSVVMTIALLAALALGSVAASNDIGLTECDAPGCAIATNGGLVPFHEVDDDAADSWTAYVSDGSGSIGFTE